MCIRDRPSLLVTDWSLSDGSGDALIMQMKDCYTGDLPPVLVISGEDNLHTKFQEIAKQNVTFLSKPIKQNKLISTIQDIINSNDS